MTLQSSVRPVAAETGSPPRFWGYLRHRELDFVPAPRLRWWLMAVITIAWATEQFERHRLSPVLVYFLEDFGIDLRQFGFIMLAGSVATGVGSYVMGHLSDRFGRRPAIVWPMVIYLVLLAGLASARSLWVYAVLYVLGAFLIMGMSAAVNAAVRDVMPRVGRAMGYAFVSLAWTLGAFMTQGVAALTIPIWPGWRPQHWIGLALASVITVLVWICYRDVTARVRLGSTLGATVESPAVPRPGTEIYRHAHIWMLASVLMWWGITYGTFAGMLPTYLTQWYGLAPHLAARITTWFFLIAGFSGFASAALSDRTRLRKPVVAAGVLAVGALTFVAARLPRDTGYETLVLTWAAVAAFSGFLYPSWCALLSENAEDLSPLGVGRAFGLSGALGIVTGVVVALVLPQVVERAGWDVWMEIAAGCAAINVVWIAFAKGPWLPASAARVDGRRAALR